jgi:hypothetical protein
MKVNVLVCCALAMALSPSAFAQKVSVEYGHQVSFASFKTYRWGKNKGQLPDPAEDAHIKHKLDRLLQAKGLRRVDTRQADFVVSYQATMNKKEQEVDDYVDDGDMGLGVGWGWGGGWGWGWGDMDPGYTATTLKTIHEGDLLVDMVDPATKRIIFRGYAEGAFHSNPVKEDQLMSKALEKMFKNFPPHKR